MVTGASPVVLRAAGDTHVGKVRSANEDSMIVDDARGLYVVLDGMGGANAGDIASQTARDAISEFIIQKRLVMEPKLLLEGAIQAACHAVHEAANTSTERQGMGTTVVACLLVDSKRAWVGHVGDSRAYLWREGRLRALTRDHTIVEELVDRGLLGAEEAERHPYKNVLSRNLGAKPETRVDLVEVVLKPGDRLMLCSDGLYGYAASDAIQYLLGSGDAPAQVARDLVELALRGGGGDNVSTIVIEAPQGVPSTSQVVRTSGAVAWWQHRQRFLQIARERGLTKNPICRALDPEEALEVVALSLCEAIFHDLEKSTGVNVWTFAQNLAAGWFERDGQWRPLRDLFDILTSCSRVVIEDVRAADAALGFLLDIAVSRALVVGELAIGGMLGERLRQVDADLVRLYAARTDISDSPDTEPVVALPESDSSARFEGQATMPFLRAERPVTSSGASSELVAVIDKTLTIARARVSPRAERVKQILGAVETIATDAKGGAAAAVAAARELYGVRPIDDNGIMMLYDAFDHARIVITASVHQTSAPDLVRAKVLAALSAAHQRLVATMASLVVEDAAPSTDRLREAQAKTLALRDEVERAELQRAALETKFAATIDQSQPWEKRGTTEW
jgi:serine/threonine protein phosphatase PrpC